MATDLQDFINESEDFNLGWAAESQVEEATGVIRNVPLCGNFSKNGYSIPATAFRSSPDRVRELYENKPVCLNHDPSKPRGRGIKELAAYVRNTSFRDGRPWGDLHTEGCPEGPTLIRLAKAKVPNVGMSHTARYTFNRNKTTVESVDEVCTVDVVLYPATTKSFTEQTSDGEKKMSDAAVEVLKQQVETQRESFEGKIADLQKRITELEGQKAALESQNKDLNDKYNTEHTKVVGFEAAQTLAARRVKVIEACKTAGIATEGEKAPKAWLDAVCAMESEDSQKAAITEFAALLKTAGAGIGPTSQERQDDSGKKWSAESALSGIRFTA